ncbi:hypothetical protein F0L68_34430 [Solihabitans fulvus]|uniref:VWFA domain-containing protein n=1 Tax=Solihabitans fulvus TaxID=1892852 RepID=A0A5B2WLI4_9PSEU|nr:hypothetical protein [Solihabitans fulvus]KAA2252863.1 hypothetical protein F0L68_34430 [Solihabitans fulvus]
MKRWLWGVVGVLVVLGLITGGLVIHLTPDHRTSFLIDGSGSDSDFREVADAVAAAAENSAHDEALALRRFGGACDQTGNTTELVSTGTDQARQVGEAAHAVVPSGRATLLSGVLAAIDDFSHTYPFRGAKSNHVVVVARDGGDACGKDENAIRALIKEHSSQAGVHIDFRFVGHKLTVDQAKNLAVIASATDAQPPKLTQTAAELTTTVKELSVPTDLAAAEVTVPKSPCESVTPEVLKAAYPVSSKAHYFDIKCQDRYVLAKANTDPKINDDLLVVFELDNHTWQQRVAGTLLPCGTVPQDVWQRWGAKCTRDPVVCRDGTSKVTDVSGEIGCPAAIDIADRYQAAVKAGQAQGQGLFWNSGEWSCSWPYLDGRPHSESPLQCERTTDKRTVRIGQ